MRLPLLLLAAVALVLLASTAQADVKPAKPKYHYAKYQHVPMFVNKIGPFHNPSETYDFYSLPVCKPKGSHIQHHHQTFTEALEGDTAFTSLFELNFLVDKTYETLCTLHLTAKEVKVLRKAIQRYYYYEMYYDDLPLHGFLGTVDLETKRVFLFKHTHFTVLYNGDQVIAANVTTPFSSSEVEELEAGADDLEVTFWYSVQWVPTDTPFRERDALIVRPSAAANVMEIHWLSILNSVVLVVLLTGFVAVILVRVLKRDYLRYSQRAASAASGSSGGGGGEAGGGGLREDEDDEDDYGWKLIHGDVFRFPAGRMVLAALLGNGAQFLCLAASLLLLGVVGVFFPERDGGSLITAAIVLYAITAGVAGYVAAAFYRQLGGEHWTWTLVLTAALFAGPFLAVAGTLNLIAAAYDATSYVSLPTVIVILAIFFFVGFPGTVIGGIAGRRLAADFDAPRRTKNFPREIPPLPWYRQPMVQICTAGFLPFSAIYIELYYIQSSIWGQNYYDLWGILSLVFLILIVVTACITVALTYFQLAAEDHRWWWRSFISGGSTGVFIFLYSAFYFEFRSRMFGFLQTAFYFGYMALIGYFFFIMLGTVGFFSSLLFVKKIYKNLHTE